MKGLGNEGFLEDLVASGGTESKETSQLAWDLTRPSVSFECSGVRVYRGQAQKLDASS